MQARMARFILAGWVVGWVVSWAVASAAESRTLHVVLLSYNEKDKPGPEGDRWGHNIMPLREMFEENVPSDRIHFIPIRADPPGEDPLTARDILDRLRHIEGVRPDDSLLLYYSGHGAFDKENRHYFWLGHTDENLYRQTVLEVLSAYHPRLVLLISDCCSSLDYKPELAQGPGIVKALPPPTSVTPVFSSLFFEPTGRVDVTSASKGEVAYRFVFTGALMEMLHREASTKPNWRQMTYRLRRLTATRLKEKEAALPTKPKEPFVQHPYAFATLPGPQLGIRVMETKDHELRVFEVVAPASEQGIIAGQTILSVDGKSVQKEDDFYDIVVESEKNSFVLEIRDPESGKVHSVTVERREIH